MGQAYTPGLKVSPKLMHSVRRILPIKGEVRVTVGDHIHANDIIAQAFMPGDIRPVNMSNLLSVPPGDVKDCLLVKRGDKVQVGDVIAQTKGIFGMFKNVQKAQWSGTLETVSDITGQVILRGDPIPVQVAGYVSGKVTEIIPDEGFIISGVLLNGKDIGPVPAYTFKGVDANQTIQAEFEEIFSVTFQVDMQFAEAYDPESDEVYLSGSMFEWARAGSLRESQLLVPSKSPRIMTNTIELTAGTYEYQYFLNGEEGAEWPRGPFRRIEVPSVLLTNDFFGYRTDPTSAGSLPPDDWLSIYPNPAHHHLFVESKEPLQTILVMDASGRVVMSAPADQNSHRLNISDLPKGLYFLKVTTQNHVFNRTVLLNW